MDKEQDEDSEQDSEKDLEETEADKKAEAEAEEVFNNAFQKTPDVDQQREFNDTKAYFEKLQKWFEQIEKNQGLDFANKLREKFAQSMALKYWLNAQASLQVLEERSLRESDAANKRAKELHKDMMDMQEAMWKDHIDQSQKVSDLLERQEARDKELHELAKNFLEKDDKRCEELDKFIRQSFNEVKAFKMKQKELEKQ